MLRRKAARWRMPLAKIRAANNYRLYLTFDMVSVVGS